MNPWNPSLPRETYKKFSIGFLEKPNEDHIIVCDKRVACQIRELVETEGVDGMDPSTYQRASQIATSKEWPSEFTMPFISPVFGYAKRAVSELGVQDTWDGLLAYADATFDLAWD